MIKKVIGYFAGAVIRRWLLGGVVTLLLGGAALMWHNHKDGLREEGRQECVQEVNKETFIQLENALAKERAANAALTALAEKTAAANAEARARQNELESRVDSLLQERNQQAETDSEYREWSDTSLPTGVAERVQNSRRSESAVREDNN